jgi:hypothetical protein
MQQGHEVAGRSLYELLSVTEMLVCSSVLGAVDLELSTVVRLCACLCLVNVLVYNEMRGSRICVAWRSCMVASAVLASDAGLLQPLHYKMGAHVRSIRGTNARHCACALRSVKREKACIAGEGCHRRRSALMA